MNEDSFATPQKHVNSQFVESPKVPFSKRGNRNWCREVRDRNHLPLKIVHVFRNVWWSTTWFWLLCITFKNSQNDKVSSSFTELLLLSLKAKLSLCEKSQEIQLSYFFSQKCQKNWLKCSFNHRNLERILRKTKWPNFS